MDFDEPARARIASALRARRSQLGMSQEEVARASGGLLSTASLRVMEGAGRSSFRSKSLTGVARALGWPPDAIERIAAGEDPARLAPPASDPLTAARPMVAGLELATVAHIAELRDELIRQRAAIAELTARLADLEIPPLAAAASAGGDPDGDGSGRRPSPRRLG